MSIFQNIGCRLIALWACLMGMCALPAQNHALLEALTVEDGLSQGFVNCIMQDREGFLWIGTRIGLNRYDGREIKVFVNDPLDLNSVSDNNVIAVTEWRDYLLIGTAQHGLNIYDKKTRRFYAPLPGHPASGLIRNANVEKIIVGQDNRIWCELIQRGKLPRIVRLTLSESRTKWEGKTQNTWQITDWKIWENCRMAHNGTSQPKDKVWGLHEGQLFWLDNKSESRHWAPLQKRVDRIQNTDSGTVWFSRPFEMGCWNGKETKWWPTDFPVSNFLYLEAEQALLCIVDGQLLRFDKRHFAGQILRKSEARKLLSIDPGQIRTLFCDRSGLVWAGTNGYGLLKYSPVLHRFTTCLTGNSIKAPLQIDDAGHVAVVPSPSSNLLIPVGNTHILSGLPKALLVNAKLVLDRMGNSWLLSRHGKQNRLELFRNDGKRPNSWVRVLSLPDKLKNSFAMVADSNDFLLIAYADQLLRYSIPENTWKSFDFSRLVPGGCEARVLAQTSGNTWWIGTADGLIQATFANDTVAWRLFTAQPGNPQTIRNNQVATLVADTQTPHVLWIGTLGGGLSRLDTRRFEFRHYHIQNGFPDNVIYGILADRKGLLWMSTNKGIARLNPATGKVKNYTVQDGIPTNEFNAKAFAQKTDGTMLFGSVKGLVSFHPDDFTDNPTTPDVRLTGLEINDRKVAVGDSSNMLTRSIEFTQKLVLPFSYNNITLRFAALEYTIPSKNRFRYYLKGAEPEWTHTTTEPGARYLNLSPGQYTFCIKACNSDGVWSTEPVVLDLTILPPWYRTIPAYCVYALLLIAFVFGLSRFLLNRQRLRDNLALEQREAERLKELDAGKSRFFANISHELRTPLTLIMSPLEQYIRNAPKQIDGKARTGLEMALKNCRKLLFLIEELLDLSKLEVNKITLRETVTPLATNVRQWFDTFQSMADMKQIDFRMHHAPAQEANYWIDRKQVEKIVNNLLSNALKFTPNGGAVTLRLGESDGHILIEVRDNGRGIPPEDLPYIFDRYFQTNQPKPIEEGGLGIGLALSKELAQLMGGDLLVESGDRGSAFTLLLPARKALATEVAPEPVVGLTDMPERVKPDKHLHSGLNGTAKERLLVVEDAPDMQKLLLGLLQPDYHCQCAADGRQAWEILNPADGSERPDFDLILSDVMMPRMNGYALLQEIKKHPHWQYCPVILLTARASESDKLLALRLGVDDYLIKPFSIDELRARVANLVGNHRRRRAYLAQEGALPPQPADAPVSADQQWLAELEEIVRVALDKKLVLSTLYLAEQASLSDRQLLRRLKALTGLSINAYIQEVKLQKARRLLETRAFHTVAEVAYACDFQTPAYFSKVYKKRFGKQPTDYREAV